jgi:hypothetical protein
MEPVIMLGFFVVWITMLAFAASRRLECPVAVPKRCKSALGPSMDR